MRHRLHRLAVAAGCLALISCSPTDLVDVDPPGDVVDPATITNADGALKLYNYAVAIMAVNFGGVSGGNFANALVNMSVFTDEAMTASLTGGTGSLDNIDERTFTTPAPNNSTNSVTGQFLFRWFQSARVKQQQGREALARYAPGAPPALQAQLYANEGFAVLWLAESFCSGVPLTSVPLVGTPQPTAGLSTQDLFARAVVLFDSAIALAGDSVRFVNLAKVGKARALLNAGQFAEAAAAVQGVPTDFTYLLTYGALLPSGSNFGAGNWLGSMPRGIQTRDNEGGNGLVWSTDPRAGIVTTPTTTGAMRYSAKYAVTAGAIDPNVASPSTPIRLADGLEARLVEAEVDLEAGGSAWLGTLNTLRATCIGTAACAPLPGLTAASLPALADPGTPAARLDLLMRERAMWLFLTGHRLGDLRRLASVYGRDPLTLFPTGIYTNPAFPPSVSAAKNNGVPYGGDFVFPVPADEVTNNPLYTGCYDKNP